MNEEREREGRVSPIELFFDLVFVFGFTQVTTVLSNNPTWSGLEHALLLLVALWWAWAAYAWLTNAVDPSDGFFLWTMMIAMGAMFVAAFAVPEAFGRHGVVFGVAFLIVAVMQLLLYALAARGDRDLFTVILRVSPLAAAGSLLILAAGFVDGWGSRSFGSRRCASARTSSSGTALRVRRRAHCAHQPDCAATLS